MIGKKETFKKFGYYPSEISPRSGKKTAAICDKCGRVRFIPKYAYRDLCQSCANKKRNVDYPVTDETRRILSEAHLKYYKEHPEACEETKYYSDKTISK